MQPFKVPSASSKSDHLGGLLQFATIGFSTRALVEALNRLGIRPVSLDAFADQDCRNRCTTAIAIEQWGTTAAVTQIVESLRAMPLNYSNPSILYAGGIENWPELALALDSQFQVLGPNAHQIQLLRCQDGWKAAAKCCDLRFPETTQRVPNGQDGWLAKPYSGAGGIHVQRLPFKPSSREFYCQRLVEGRVLGMQCSLGQSGTKLLGVTESWSDRDWPGPTEFIYRGSWGPIEITPQQHAQVQRLGDHFHETTGHVGWIGFDMIEDASGQLWLLEVNPRWTAGMEILCKAGMPSPVSAHLDEYSEADRLHRSNPVATNNAAPGALWGKAVFYASEDIVLTRSLLQELHAKPSLRDVPSIHAEGQLIQQGLPLLTLYAHLPYPPQAVARASRSFTQEREQLLKQLHELYGEVMSCIR